MHLRINTKVIALLIVFAFSTWTDAGERWSAEKAQRWYSNMPWLVGCNYAPRSAINQLEMWQADTFDPDMIDEELGWAEELGFSSVRVFLHHLLWEQDEAGFCKRIDQFLEIADRHNIGVMLVLFDGVWDPHPQLGKQRAPYPHRHNSGWVQSPGAELLGDPAKHESLKPYVTGIISRYRNDTRVQIWDLFNEPENGNHNSYGQQELPNKEELALCLLNSTFVWAREVNPVQPLTAGVWRGDWSSVEKMSEINRVMIQQSDIITYHTYDNFERTHEKTDWLKSFNRPLLCTEYMARPNQSRFDPHLRYFKENKIGAYNWGFVSGKTQTIYPWDSWQKRYTAEPSLWHHDIFRADGTAYSEQEVMFIKKLTRK